MKRNWSQEQLIEDFTISPKEMQFILTQTRHEVSKVGLALQLKYFQYTGSYPNHSYQIPQAVANYIYQQLAAIEVTVNSYNWQGRTAMRHRGFIRNFLGFRKASLDDENLMTKWLLEEVVIVDSHPEYIQQRLIEQYQVLKIETPGPSRIERMVNSAVRQYEQQICKGLIARIPDKTKDRLDDLLVSYEDKVFSVFGWLKDDPGGVSLKTAQKEIEKLKRIQEIGIDEKVFEQIPTRLIEQYRQRAINEPARELRRHPPYIRYSLLASFCFIRSRQITDDLIELIIQLIHKIESLAKKRVEKGFIKDIKKVKGKNTLLHQLALAALENPNGKVCDVLFPVVSEQTLKDLVKEFRSSGTKYTDQVYIKMRSSYSHHYRQLLPKLLSVLDIKTNHTNNKSIIQAWEILKTHAESTGYYYPLEEEIPLKGIVPEAVQTWVTKSLDDNKSKINRISYELCVLRKVREHIRSKAIWITGAAKFNNPDKDLPLDFDQKRESYYAHLKQPLDVETFIQKLKTQMEEGLSRLNKGMPSNPKVKILQKNKGWISLSPIEKQADPPNLQSLKKEMGKRWPMTSLLDILKETDMRVGFTQAFSSSGVREHLSKDELQKRMLLCLYGLGTNTGIKRMSSVDRSTSYDDLLYTRRRFIRQDSLRNAIIKVSNGIFKTRLPHIWGEATTSCASDAKKFGAYDQNLMTEWHIRYRGPGIMIYWHVEKNSVCICSQLKRPSSSEVAAMIHGLLHHNTDMELKKNYVDTHGQNEVAFAFCHVLGFELLPRLKNIYKQRLYRPEKGTVGDYPHIKPIMRQPIRWDLIREHYDEILKYATALRLKTADVETLLRRFTKGEVIHPIYQALSELGKATKTIFLCKYLHDYNLRQEIHEGLQVVENWNSANGFIFFGKGGEISVNRKDDQEVSMLSLHLIQNSLAYVNTLMIQNILQQPSWENRLTVEDKRALRPLQYGYVNPYGSFSLDMNSRLQLEQQPIIMN